jgi:capsular exopolysaccharide synthesis family protein
MQASAGPGQPDLLSLIKALWRRKWLFLGIVVSIPAIVYVISTRITETYETSALIRVQPTNVNPAAPPNLAPIDSEALLVESEAVERVAAKELGQRDSVGDLADKIEAEPFTPPSGTASTDLLLLVAQAETPNRAAAIANAYAAAVDNVRTRRALAQIQTSMDRLEAETSSVEDPAARTELARQLQALRASRAQQEDTTQLLQPAIRPSSPISPHPRRNTALAGLVAVLLGLLAVTLRERTDRRLRDSDELEPIFGTPLLSVIPKAAFPGGSAGLEGMKEPFRREPFQTLAASLVYFNIDRPLGTVMIASPTKGDGKTTVATYLAAALARDGQEVVLVDCDLRRPQVAARLGIEPRAGLDAVLMSQAEVDDALIEVDVGEGRLQVLACTKPPPNPARMVGSAALGSLLTELSERADIVIVDTPPILHVSDAVPLLERVSGTVVVARLNYTSRDALARLRQVIDSASGDVLGTVLTGAHASGLYGYGYYDYGRDAAAAAAAEAAAEDEKAPTDAASIGAATEGRSNGPGGKGEQPPADEKPVDADDAGEESPAPDETVEFDAVEGKLDRSAKRGFSFRRRSADRHQGDAEQAEKAEKSEALPRSDDA